MPAGLEVFDPQGRPWLSITDRITRYLGQHTTQTVDDGSIYVPELALGAPWFCVLPTNGNPGLSMPDITISGQTLSWRYHSFNNWLPPQYRTPFTIIYGVY
jgi:hypothetical protein